MLVLLFDGHFAQAVEAETVEFVRRFVLGRVVCGGEGLGLWGELNGSGGEGEAGSGWEAVARGQGYGVKDHAEGGDLVVTSYWLALFFFFFVCVWIQP